MFARIASRNMRVIYACDIQLYKNNIGNDVFFAHNGLGVIISREARIGDNCAIYQHVIIGVGKDGYPTIGNNVTIYANTVIIGEIQISDNAVIGACSFVNKDVPANSVYAGVPAKRMR